MKSVTSVQPTPPIFVLKTSEDGITTVETKTELDTSKFNSLKDFSEELEKYSSSSNNTSTKKKKKKQKKQEIDEKLDEDVTNLKPSCSFVTHEFISSLLNKCLTTEQFWSKEGFDSLLKNRHITIGVDDELIFDCIFKYKSYTSLKVLADSVIAIQEGI